MGGETTKHPDCAHLIAYLIKKVPEFQGLNFEGADRTGLEPATSAVTGRHSNQLNYRSSIEGAKIVIFFNNQTLFISLDYYSSILIPPAP